MIMDGEAHDLFAGLIDLWGEAKATSFLRSRAGTEGPIFATISYVYDSARRYRRA